MVQVKTMMTAILIFFTMVLTLLGFWSAKTDVDESAKHLAWYKAMTTCRVYQAERIEKPDHLLCPVGA